MTKKTLNASDREIGSRVRQARKAKGLTQTQLGEALGVSFQQVQKYERGINRISSSALVEIAQALDVSPVQLFTGVNAPDVSSPEADLTRRFLAHPCGLVIAKAVLDMPTRDAATIAAVSSRMASLHAQAATIEHAAAA